MHIEHIDGKIIRTQVELIEHLLHGLRLATLATLGDNDLRLRLEHFLDEAQQMLLIHR